MADRTYDLEIKRNGKVYRGAAATIWVCDGTGDVVVTGNPRSVEPEGCGEEEGHNCDAAGCGSSHVLARGHVVGVFLDDPRKPVPPIDQILSLYEMDGGNATFQACCDLLESLDGPERHITIRLLESLYKREETKD